MMLRPTLLVAALAASSFAWGQALDPPERIARLSYVEGQVAFQPAHEPPGTTLPDRPLAPGDRLMTERGGRAELALGHASVRLDEASELAIVALDATTVRLELAAGTASVHLRELYEDDVFEIATPNTMVALDAPGEYRVEVPADSATALTVRGGIASVATAGGPVRVADGQRVQLEGRDAFANLVGLPPADDFDDWVLNREVQLADAEPPRYTPYEGEDAGYEELDSYGEWYDEPRYGRVWMPSYAYGGWSPFSHGRWVRVGFGWSWFNPLPWHAFTFHSGRWAFLHHVNRWCWVPGPRFHGRHFRHHGRHFDHQRRFVQDTRPFGHPRRGDRARDDRDDRDEPPRDARSRENGEEVLRRALWRSNPKTDERRPVATTRSEPRRIDADRPSVFRPDVETMKRSQAASDARSREDLARSPSWRTPSVSRSGATTMRPSSSSRTVAPSRSSSSASSRSSSASRAARSAGDRTQSSSTSSRSTRGSILARPR